MLFRSVSFLKIPKETVALEVTAFLLDDDGKLMRVATSLSVSDIRDRRQDFLDHAEDGDDTRYVMTEEGRAYLKQMENNREARKTDG